MESLLLGLTAALVWGLHDFTVRRVSATASAAALYMIVLGFGVLWILPFAALSAGWSAFTPGLTGFTVLAGLIYSFGVYALYRAFAIGPVRLVVLLAWRFLGEAVRPVQWGGIAVAFAGVAVLSSQG